MSPNVVVPFLQEHLRRVKQLHEQDLARGYGRVDLPFSLERKYPNVDREWIWQYVFPASALAESAHRAAVPPPHPRRHPAEGCTPGGYPGRHPQTCQLPDLSPLLRYPPAGERLRHPHRPGAARPQGRQDHHGLHPRPPAQRPARAQPAGFTPERRSPGRIPPPGVRRTRPRLARR